MDIFTLCTSGNYEAIEQMLLEHNDLVDSVQTVGQYTGNLLMFAVRFHQYNVVQLLLQHGADVNGSCGVKGVSALTIAVEENLLDIGILLLKNGAVVQATDFWLCVTKKHWALAEHLLQYDFDLFHVDKTGNSFMYYIVCGNALQVADALLRKNPACLTLNDSSGKSALGLAEEKHLNDMAMIIKSFSVMSELDKIKFAAIKMYDEDRMSISNAHKNYTEKMLYAEQLRYSIKETEDKLNELKMKLENAEREEHENKTTLHHELERISKTVTSKTENFLLECPICMDVPFHPKTVLQCNEGHSICSDCRKNVTHCPVCRQQLPMEMIRNRKVEELINRSKP